MQHHCDIVDSGWHFFGGLAIAPSDYQQGDGFRIIYIHVPAAFTVFDDLCHNGCHCFCRGLCVAKLCDASLIAMAPIGFVFTLTLLCSSSFGANLCAELSGSGMQG